MDESLKSYHITMMNLISPKGPQTPPWTGPPLSKQQEVASFDEVFYWPTDNEIMSKEKVNEISNNLEDIIVNNLPPEPKKAKKK